MRKMYKNNAIFAQFLLTPLAVCKLKENTHKQNYIFAQYIAHVFYT